MKLMLIKEKQEVKFGWTFFEKLETQGALHPTFLGFAPCV